MSSQKRPPPSAAKGGGTAAAANANANASANATAAPSLAVVDAPPPEPADPPPEMAPPTPETPPLAPTGESEIVAVGTISHVVRRAFHQFYAAPVAVQTPTSALAPETAADPAAAATAIPDANATGHGDDVKSPATSTPRPTSTGPSGDFARLGTVRKQIIHEELGHRLAQAGELVAYLESRRAAALAEDEVTAAALSRQGLILGAQLPMGPSPLRIDPAALETYGTFAATLVHANALVRQYDRGRLERSGNDPRARPQAAVGLTRERPGYLSTTSASDIRKAATLAIHHAHVAETRANDHAPQDDKSHETTEAPEDGGGGRDDNQRPEATRPRAAAVMPAPERRRNLAILDKMQAKLDFLRNPRYAGHAGGAANESPAFVAVPSPVTFTDYDAGGIYEQAVYLRNTSALSRRLRVLPPATLYFSIDRVVFPDESGLVAPGMHVEVRLRFCPDSRADYKDALAVQSELAPPLHVPLAAHRRPPELSIPVLLRAEPTLVGAHSKTRLACRNTGGRGRFWLLNEGDWARCEATPATAALPGLVLDRLQQRDAHVRVGPFTLAPSSLELEAGASVTLELAFVPSGIGEHREKFVMVCDNCLVRVFQLVGRGCQVELAVTAVNDRAIDAALPLLAPVRQLTFAAPDGLQLGAQCAQSFALFNATPVDLAFSWRVADADAETGTEAEFVLAPAAGRLRQQASTPFRVTFGPRRPGRRLARAELVLHEIPPCSVPGPAQLGLLGEALAVLQARAERQSPLAWVDDDETTAGTSGLAPEVLGALGLDLCGLGRLGAFALDPPRLMLIHEPGDDLDDDDVTGERHLQQQVIDPEELARDATYRRRVRVVNATAAPVAFAWDVAAASLRGGQRRGLAGRVGLEVTPLSGVVEPHAHETIEIRVRPRRLGAFSLTLPCRIPVQSPTTTTSDTSNTSSPTEQASGFVRVLLIEGRVGAPGVEFAVPEVDFGLVLASATAEQTLELRNPSARAPAEWRMLHLEATPAAPGPSSIGPSQAPALLHTHLTTADGGPGGMRRVGSSHSISSRASTRSGGQETARSGASSGNGLFTARDLPPRARVVFAPERGRLEPGATLTVRVTCVTGARPERFRGRLACALTVGPTFDDGEDEDKATVEAGAEHVAAVLSARAEIQSPSVFLRPLRLALGTTYLGVPVERTIELVNVSNLEAAFKFAEPEGPSKLFELALAPREGRLGSKETRRVRLTYTPRQAGRSLGLVACAVQGLPGPLGLELATTQRGLVLTYEVARPPTASRHRSPRELARDRGRDVSDGDLEPETSPTVLPKLAFGDDLALGERRALDLVIRNYSGIHARLELEPRKFRIAAAVTGAQSMDDGPPPQDESPSSAPGSSSSISPAASGSSSPSRRRRGPPPPSQRQGAQKRPLAGAPSSSPTAHSSNRTTTSISTNATSSMTSRRKGPARLLSDAHEPAGRFQSDPGRAYIRASDHALADRALLALGHGVAFQLEALDASGDASTATNGTGVSAASVSVEIAPWGLAVVRVTCLSNMPGAYADVLACRAAPSLPPCFLPMTATVRGSPLQLDHNCVGLHFARTPVAVVSSPSSAPTKASTPTPKPPPPRPPPALAFGAVLVRSAPVTRELRVVNRGPRAARLRWRLAVPGTEDQVVRVTLRVDARGRVALAIAPCVGGGAAAAAGDDDDDSDDSDGPDGDRPPARGFPFEVVPPVLVVPKFATVPVRVTFFPATTTTASRALLLADATWLEDPAPPIVLPPRDHDDADGDDSGGGGGEDARVEDGIATTTSGGTRSLSITSARALATAAGKAMQAVRIANSLARSPNNHSNTNGSSGGSSSNSSGLTGTAAAAAGGVSPKCLEVLLTAEAVAPELVVVEQAPPITFTTWATIASPAPVPDATHVRVVHLANALGARVSFRLETAGPFAVARADSLAPRHPLAPSERPAAHRRADGEGFLFVLPPRMAVRLELRFDPPPPPPPPPPAPEASHAGTCSDHGRRLETIVDGQLHIRFATGAVQTLGLRGRVLRPLLVVAPAVHRFGRVHLTRRRHVVLRVANPTAVPATFCVEHVPRPPAVSKAQRQELARHHAQFTDDPSVFTFAATRGCVPGPTLSLRAAGGARPSPSPSLLGGGQDAAASVLHRPLELLVSFAPRERRRRYRSRFRLVVAHGIACEVVLEGEGHLDEAEYGDQDPPGVPAAALTHDAATTFRRFPVR